MKKSFNGKKYHLEIVSKAIKGNNLFFIKAKEKLSDRYSYVNNLNCILSEFDIDINNPLVSQSYWYINRKQAKIFFKKADEFLNDKHFLFYLEQQLDLDRFCGEWENIENI